MSKRLLIQALLITLIYAVETHSVQAQSSIKLGKGTLNGAAPYGNPINWSARLEMCQWIRETLDKESIWDVGKSTSLSR